MKTGDPTRKEDKMNTLGIGDVEVEMSGVGKPPKIITEITGGRTGLLSGFKVGGPILPHLPGISRAISYMSKIPR